MRRFAVRLEILAHDLRRAARGLVDRPAFALTAASTLALGTGAAAAIFSLADAVLFRPLPVRAPHELVQLYTADDGGPSPTSYHDFEVYRAAREVFTDLAAQIWAPLPLTVGPSGATERVWGEAVSGSYFDVLGPAMHLGRGLAADGAPEVVLGYDYWRRRFAGRHEVLGEAVRIDGRAYTVVGVAGRAFRGTSLELGVMGGRPEMWLPLAHAQPAASAGRGGVRPDAHLSRYQRMLAVTGRLAPGVDLAGARAAVRRIAADLATERAAADRSLGASVGPGGSAWLSPQGREAATSFLLLLFAGSAFLLLAACVNVAHLWLGRSLERSREWAIRVALGAGRGRLALHVLVECLLVSLLGLVLSIPVTLATQHLLVRYSLPFGVPIDCDLRLDGRVLGSAAALAVLTAAAFGLAAALKASRPNLRSAIQGPLAAAGGRPSRAGAALVAMQVAFSLALVVGAGLFVRSLDRYARVEPGFRVDDVLVMSVALDQDEARGRRFYQGALERVRTLPGVRAASWAGDVPLGVRQIIIRFFPAPRDSVDESEWTVTKCDVVSTDYFRTLGISIRGREFTDRDDAEAPEVAVVNETLSRRYWPDGDTIGRRFKVLGRTGLKTVEVVGVAADVRQRSLREDAEPRLYLALGQRHFPEMTLHARVGGPPRDSIARIRAELAALEPDLAVFYARPLREQVDDALSQPRMAAALMSASALLTLVLAAIGVHAMAARAAAGRRREVGIRMALGALPSEVRRLVLRREAVPVAVGILLGVCASLAMGRLAETFLFGVHGADLLTYAASTFLLAAVAAAAIDIPARRAAALDPALALRHE